MIGFLETCASGGMVPIETITRVDVERIESGKVETRRVHLGIGRHFDLFEHEVDELRMRPAQITPTLPGISYLRMVIEDTVEGGLIAAEPVIAWALCLDGVVRPVTPNGVCGGMSLFSDHYVEMPDGGVQSVGRADDICCFNNRLEMLRHFVAIEKLSAKPREPSELAAEVQ